MKLTSVVLYLCLIALFCVVPVMAHQEGGPSEKLGQVHFPVSCSDAAQQQFDRAVALLHSFWYEEAVKAFTQVTQTDPRCAMGSWGMAMSLWYPLWYPPSPAALQQGAAAVEQAKATGAPTAREQAYIAAIEAFYKEADKLDHRTRAVAYEKAMEQLHLRYPDDREATVFYALALDTTAVPTDKTYANQLKAAELLEQVFAEEPNHPGVAHYLIHSYDYPPLAGRALTAARSYAKIAPSAPHALHMPSHIFTRLGLWQESIQSNAASAAASKEYASKVGAAGAWPEQLHSMDYLTYAYLQGAQDRDAKRVVDELLEIQKAEPESLPAAYAFAAIPARYALERRRWADAATLTLHPGSFPWSRFRWGEAITVFSRALGAARSGDVAKAGKEVDTLQSLHSALVEAKQSYWADQVEIQRRAAAAWVAHAEGKHDEALALMRSAADLESSTEKHPVTPGPIVPARELLGELLLDLNQPAQALAELEASLRTDPNRLNGLYGAARAAELSGDHGKARTYYASLVALCEQADSERPELLTAKAFLAKQ
jgi:tetratricopeptide (TPR) repeat protein